MFFFFRNKKDSLPAMLPGVVLHMAHAPDKFWYAQAYSDLCDCGHALKDQLHRHFISGDSDDDDVNGYG